MKLKQLTISFAFLLVTSTSGLLAQEVIATSGDFHESDNGSLSWTLGEIAIETHSNTNNIITQGFQQTKLTITSIDEMRKEGISVNIYPNPTSEVISIEVNKTDEREVYFKLFGKDELNMIAEVFFQIDIIIWRSIAVLAS